MSSPDGRSDAPGKMFAASRLSLASVGVVAYGICYSTLSRFYTELGISPEVVGLDYRAVLSRSVGFLIFALLLSTLLYLMMWAIQKKLENRYPQATRLSPYMVIVVVIIISLVGWGLLGRAVDKRDAQVLAGQPIAPISLLGTTLISLHTYPVTAPTVSGASFGQIDTDQLSLIGSSSGTVVVFDASRERSATSAC
jgi:hypothetical protein